MQMYNGRPCGTRTRASNRWTRDELIKEAQSKNIDPIGKTMDQICQLLSEAPSTKTSAPYIKTNDPCFETTQKYEEHREYVKADKTHVYKVVKLDSVEFLCYERLAGTDLIPKIEFFKECINEGQKSLLIKMEKYDGDLGNYVRTNPTTTELTKSLQEIIEKSLRLNFEYNIRHQDFHEGNIVYKKTPSGIKWAFIDFELSIVYDEHKHVVKTGFDKRDSRLEQYNPYYDLINLEYNLLTKSNYMVLKAKKGSLKQYRDHYNSGMNEADIEMMDEIKSMKKSLKPIVFTINVI